jgi:hypothetical protein
MAAAAERSWGLLQVYVDEHTQRLNDEEQHVI